MHPHNNCPYCKRELEDKEALEALIKSIRISAQDTLEALSRKGIKFVVERKD